MPNPQTFYFTLPANNRPPFVPLNEEVHPSFQWLTQNRATARGRDVFTVIDTIVIHSTAGFASQHAVDTWHRRAASAHWIIPDEDEPQHGRFIWATVAEAKAANHVKRSINVNNTVLGPGPIVNNRSLGVEIVNSQNVQNYSDPFSTWQIEMAARVVLYAWAKYPNLKHVVSHANLDPTDRADPGRQFPWDAFKNMVLNHTVLPERDPLVFKVNTKPMPKDGYACTP